MGNELLGNCIIKHYKENCHRIVPFLLTHVMLLVRIMRDCAGICELCDRMRFLINYAGSHHRTISEALFIVQLHYFLVEKLSSKHIVKVANKIN